MSKAYEIMTCALETCAPDAHVSSVAATMRDRNIGDVLVVEDGQLRGIVTDRDLAIQALTGQDDPEKTPVHKYMSSPVVTGEPDWSLQKVSETMARHQIRRLPIVQEGRLAGIISLGDVALHTDKKQAVAKSLQAISEPPSVSLIQRVGSGKVLTVLALVASATTIATVVILNQMGPAWRKKLTKKVIYHTAKHALNVARAKVEEVAPRETVLELRDHVLATLNELSDHLSEQATVLQPKPKRKHFWSV
jgi:CBS domain-containing protein